MRRLFIPLCLFMAVSMIPASIHGQRVKINCSQAVRHTMSAVPQSWRQPISRFLNSPDMSAAQLDKALRALSEQLPLQKPSAVQAQPAWKEAPSLEEQTPALTAQKLSELSLVLAPYKEIECAQLMAAAEEARAILTPEKRRDLNLLLQRTAQALGLFMEISSPVSGAEPGIGKWSQEWRLQKIPADKAPKAAALSAIVPAPEAGSSNEEPAYYRVLGLTRQASPDQVKSAFRRLVKKYHPDNNKNSREQESLYRDIVEAYSVLRDPELRAAYDRGEQPAPKTREPEEYVSADDPFVERFDLRTDVRHAYNHVMPAILTKDRKVILDAFVQEQERLYAQKQPDEILRHHRQSVVSPDKALNDLTDKVFFSLIGEHAKNPLTQSIADQVLEGIWLEYGTEKLEMILSKNHYLFRLGRDEKEMPILYPNAITRILSSLAADGFDENVNGRAVIRHFMTTHAIRDYPAFYEKIAQANPVLWRAVAFQRHRLISGTDTIGMHDGEDISTQVQLFIKMLKTRGAEVDAERIRMIRSLMFPSYRSNELLSYAELIEQILRIKDFSSFELRSFTFRVMPESGSTRKMILDRLFGSVIKQAPDMLLREMQEFERFLETDDRRRRFREAASYLDPYYAQVRRQLGRGDSQDLHRLSSLADKP